MLDIEIASRKKICAQLTVRPTGKEKDLSRFRARKKVCSDYQNWRRSKAALGSFNFTTTETTSFSLCNNRD